MEMYMVGGAVRDELLGVKSNDIDFSVVLGANSNWIGPDPFRYMVDELKEMGFRIFLESPEFLTVRAQFPKGDQRVNRLNRFTLDREGLTADFVLARKEGTYTDGRRPDVVEVGTLLDDLSRRDFTMNAIAKGPDGSLIDPFDGEKDIAAEIIRAVGNPYDRLTEDALRAVRALRFSVTTGFRIESMLAHAMQHPNVLNAIRNKISDERITAELSKMFRFNTLHSVVTLGQFPLLTEAMFYGAVSLDATMKQKGRG